MSTKKLIGIVLIVAAIILIIPMVIAAMAFGFSGTGAADCGTGDTGTTVSDSGDSVNGSNGLGPGGDKPPAKFIPIYQAAAARFNLDEKGPSVLAGIHYEETKFGDDGSNKNGGPYEGPMAWGHAYFDSYAVAHDGKTKKQQDLFIVSDAVYASANRLKEAGAPRNWHDAIYAYNHSNEYVSAVLADADKYQIPATGGGGTSGGGSGAECDPGAGGGGTVSGNVQELAQQILDLIDKGKITQLYKSPTGDTIEQLKHAANGQKFQMTCTTHGGPKDVDINPDILKAVIEASGATKVDISNITDKCHTDRTSNHYSGEAIDLGCATGDINAVEKAFAKYGGKNNGEVCPGSQHWHYDFLK